MTESLLEQPLVSVVVPACCVVEYLRECAESILTQSYRNLEVIIVDDGSPDKSGVIADDIATRDARVTVIHQENQGLSAARNAGMDLATGSFIVFVDGDDWVHPEVVAFLMEQLRRTDADVAVSGFGRDPEEVRTADPGAWPVAVLDSRATLAGYLGERNVQLTVTWGKLYRRALFDDVRFPVGRAHEDEFTTYRVVARAATVVVSDAPLYFYRVNPSGLTSTRGYGGIRARLDRLDAFCERADLFRAWGLGSGGYRPILDECLALRSTPLVREDFSLMRALARRMREPARRLMATRQPLAYRILLGAVLVSARLADMLYRIYARWTSVGKRATLSDAAFARASRLAATTRM